MSRGDGSSSQCNRDAVSVFPLSDILQRSWTQRFFKTLHVFLFFVVRGAAKSTLDASEFSYKIRKMTVRFGNKRRVWPRLAKHKAKLLHY